MTDGGAGLSEKAASGLAYITFIPAVIFLVLEPYSKNRSIRFHCIQCLGLTVAWIIGTFLYVVPLVGWMLAIGLHLTLAVCWIIAMGSAFRGGRFKVPIIGPLAEEQAAR